ncbi:MAG TPA: glycosyltransferase family 4 protein, partial [Dehalococcoidia bacterium]|nr:glycosyltransferase family 4 protein [Dehalococcoidia bacterium]
SQRHEVSAVSFFENEGESRYISELKQFCRRVVVVRRYPYPPAVGPLRLMPWQIAAEFGAPEMAAAIHDALSADDFDIVQCEYLQMAYLMPRLRREVTVLKEHEVQYAALWKRLRRQPNPLKSAVPALHWLKWLQAEVALCRRFDRVIAVTPEDRRMLGLFDPSLKVEVIEAAVDTDYFQPQDIAEEENSLVYVGAYRHYPNVDAACYLVEEILPLVRTVIPEVKLYLVGSAGSTELPQHVRQEPGVTVTDWVEDIRPWLARASVGVFPIRLGVGIRGKILQAWGMGKAVVSTTLGAAGLGPRHGENVWIANDTHDFAQGVMKLLQDPDLRRKLGAGARARVVERYGQQAWIGRYEQLYYDLVQERGRLLP